MGSGSGRPGLSEAEMEVLKVLWDLGPEKVRAVGQVLERRGRRWAYTTVATLLQRLVAKGYAAASVHEVAHVFHASVSRDDLLGQRLKDAADELCDGNAAPLLLALVQGHRFTPEELARFRRLLDEAEEGSAQQPKKTRLAKVAGKPVD